jgi:hypothetical protein
MKQKDAPVEALRTANNLQNELVGQRQKRSWQTPEIQQAAFHFTANVGTKANDGVAHSHF